MKKHLSILIAVLMLIFSFAACGDANTSDDPLADLTLYESDTGISLYMEKGYEESEAEGVTCCFKGDILVSCREETFETLESVGYDGSLSIEEYAELLVSYNGTGAQVLSDDYGNVYFVYEQEVMDVPLTYYAYVDKGSNSFWTTNFLCPTENVDDWAEKFALWGSTIVIK